MQGSYSYKVKVINPNKKTDIIIRQLHHYHHRFESVFSLRATIVQQLAEQVPNSTTFQVGYEDSKKNKISIINDDDLRGMYSMKKEGEFTLWCEGKQSDSDGGRKRKRSEDTHSRYREKEEEVEEVASELLNKHKDKYEYPLIRLWARMIASHQHKSLENPPNIPIFTGKSTAQHTIGVLFYYRWCQKITLWNKY